MAMPILRRGTSPVSARRNNDTYPRIDPWNDMASLDRLFEGLVGTPLGFARGLAPYADQATASGGVELYETKDELTAFVFAPGMARDAFDITVNADTVTVKGERKPLIEAGEQTMSHTPWLNLATSNGTFSTTYQLPIEIDPSSVSATYVDGVLSIRMAKSEAAKPKSIKVELK